MQLNKSILNTLKHTKLYLRQTAYKLCVNEFKRFNLLKNICYSMTYKLNVT